MSNGVDSILAFLDSAERSESRRRIPTAAELRKKSKQKETNLKKEIQKVKDNINELNNLKTDSSKQREEHRFNLMKIQAQMDRVISEKETLSKKLEDLNFELSEFSRTESHRNHPEVIQSEIDERVKQAISESLIKLKSQLSAKIRKITEEEAYKAQIEFGPHIKSLKMQHNSEVSDMKSKYCKKIEKIKNDERERLNEELSSIRQNFYDQTESQILIIEKQNEKNVNSLQNKNERERKRYEKDIENIFRTAESEVNEIKARYQKMYERERLKNERLIEEAKNDVILAKKRGEAQISHFENVAQKKDDFFNKLNEIEFDLQFDESNKIFTKNKKKEFQEDLNEFRETMENQANKEIELINDQIERKSKNLMNEIDFLNREIERNANLKEKEANFRIRQEKRTLGTKKELSTLTENISMLKDQLFDLNSEVITSKSQLQTENSRTDSKLKHFEKCSQIKEEINNLKSELEKEKEFHKIEIENLNNVQKTMIAKTSERVKSIIEGKDRQISQLNEQLIKEKEKIDSLAAALHLK
ncbi:hypothetical protein TRFO_02764 [Tritrichomonas foetus]|uniref:Uncharacterized protein n=1 Tax=Tritrichomonas foetus TaxID=1144522 RepID=A0A1J4KYZ9_9EUKA|nr:hypothetical protein TRFO_02764 [Tritrichomonas foetus]|eukprot:OHT16483.1 hypothetical protein TRFO_02764 [Tritrichomonas foetus]